MTTLHFNVRGRVQGVGFRWWVRSRALELSITGHVRNREDGSVEVLATGSDDALDVLRRSLHIGPSAAAVEDVEEAVASPDSSPGFEIVE
ncbi:MAG: acylphosphatase [Gemmatimonas sp.]|nr:acylphosphatase [Gemmatimonas sp.]